MTTPNEIYPRSVTPGIDLVHRLGGLLAFCGRAQTSEPMNEIYRDFYAALEQTLADETGETDSARARALAGSTIAAVDGVGLCATLHPKLWPGVRQREALRALLGEGLGLTDHEENGHD